MLRKPRSYNLKNNFFVVVFAMMLIAIVFYMKNPETQQDNLKANILSIREDQSDKKIEESAIFYSISTGILTIYSNKVFEGLSGMEMKIVFDDEKVSLSNKNIFSDFDFDIQKDTGIGTIKFKGIRKLNNNQRICLLNFSGNQNDIVLGEIKMFRTNGQEKNPSIGRK